MNVAHHMHYLAWFEMARTEWLRSAGTSYRDIEETRELQFPVIELAVRYKRPARYDDVLEVRTWLRDVRRSRMRFEYEILRHEDHDDRVNEVQLATGHTLHACTGANGRATRMPRSMMETLVSC